ncbi:Depudecin biosynthesis cluster-specific transcription activator DEP6 [Metarhizium anisopliae]|nr:Depudecin biosynthesis cluster-specific transcription activator DEP6 [Metarhizium anisopliae]
MRLKRGLERESCDFCHRRKIRCDRSSRLAGGEPKCSQCDLRQIACSVDDSNDVRIQRRKQTRSAHVAISDSGYFQEAGSAPSKDAPSTATLEPAIANLTPQGTISPDTHNTPFTGTPSFLLSDNLFDLSADSILFLDQIFMGDPSSSEWTNTPLSLAPSQDQLISEALSPDDQHHELWESCNMDSATFKAALRLYFTHAALCLPILLQDAFWQDYESNRCCHALIYAIACRGMPFTDLTDKWEMQQRLANKFKESFFEHQSTPGRGTDRLDDIEALALMTNFQYENNTASSLPAHMETLFLSLDSLVMMTLQYRLEENASSSSSLSRAPERRTLLFWHVYGLDAFNNLDHKKLSRIPDTDIDITASLPRNEAHSYLDAILSLAIIARNMGQKFCTATCRRQGVKLADVEALYRQLDSWRARCPDYLRHCDSGRPSRTDVHVQLQRCVMRLLEASCYLQIQGFVDEYGICQEANLGGEMACFRVEYESVRAVKDAVDMCNWMARYDNDRRGTHTLVDLAPNILRDICAGLGVWASIRGTKLIKGESVSSPYVIKIKGWREPAGAEDAKKRKLWEYLDTAKLFRSTVARAVSHKDTDKTLERVDEFLGPFMDDLEQMQADRVS